MTIANRFLPSLQLDSWISGQGGLRLPTSFCNFSQTSRSLVLETHQLTPLNQTATRLSGCFHHRNFLPEVTTQP